MALILDTLPTLAMGDASYLVGDDAARVAAVIDPQPDIERYLERARRHGVAITHVFQTHVHEDFVSGACALAVAAGAALCVGGEDAPAYGYPHRALRDGDAFTFGGSVLTVHHTPGHTPEHVALLLAPEKDPDAPFAVFSGGALLADAAGRTDLLGPDLAEDLARAQQRSLQQFFMRLPDGVVVYPTHVHGSPCGAAIGERLRTTIGHERRHNPLLQVADDADAFVRHALADLPPKPRYYPRLKERNTQAPPPAPPAPRALPPQAFAEVLAAGEAQLVDTRDQLAFGGGHIAGALALGAAGHLAIWAGWMLDAARPLLLVLDSDERLPAVRRELARTGLDRIDGWLAGGMAAWQNAGHALQPLEQLTVERLADERDAWTALDVRQPQEWQQGHVPGARHLFLPELPARLAELDRDAPIAVYCDSGYRASVGASLLQRAGFRRVASVPGSWQAWQARGLPVEKPKGS